AAKLARDEADTAHPVVRAARVYLDVIFVHPFPDGNARLARLAAYFVLRRAGLPVPAWDALIRVRKMPGAPESYWRFVFAVARRSEARATPCDKERDEH